VGGLEVASLTRGDLQLPIKPNEGCIGAVTVDSSWTVRCTRSTFPLRWGSGAGCGYDGYRGP